MEQERNSMVNVVIAEDQPVLRVGLKAALLKTGDVNVVGEADNGATAVSEVLRLKPNVALVDIEMPQQSGIEATRRIKEALPATRVVMLTSHTDDANLFRAIEAGADAYVVKSSNFAKLAMAINAVLQGAAWFDAAVARKVINASNSGYEKEASAAPVQALTKREIDVVKLMASGMGNQEIAEQLNVSIETVKTHIRRLMEKLNVTNRTEAVVRAMQLGVIA
jgi:DNA-binding NarL/FixJ family response regulator